MSSTEYHVISHLRRIINVISLDIKLPKNDIIYIYQTCTLSITCGYDSVELVDIKRLEYTNKFPCSHWLTTVTKHEIILISLCS